MNKTLLTFALSILPTLAMGEHIVVPYEIEQERSKAELALKDREELKSLQARLKKEYLQISSISELTTGKTVKDPYLVIAWSDADYIHNIQRYTKSRNEALQNYKRGLGDQEWRVHLSNLTVSNSCELDSNSLSFKLAQGSFNIVELSCGDTLYTIPVAVGSDYKFRLKNELAEVNPLTDGLFNKHFTVQLSDVTLSGFYSIKPID